MSPHEVGCYMRLLCHQWSRGQIPHRDMQKVRRVSGGVVSDEVMKKFPNGKNERLERERIKQQVWREKSREGGLKSGLTRASRVVEPPLQPPLQPNGQPKGNTPSPSPDSITHTLLEANLPTWNEVKSFAEMHAIKPESAKSFFDHHEGNQLWVNQHGRLINWKHKIVTWATNDRTKPTDAIQKPASKMTEKEILQQCT